MQTCACGQPATSGNSRNECSACYRDRLGSVYNGFTPTSKGIDTGLKRSRQRKLDLYAAARAEGIQPAGTSVKQVDEARRISDLTGTAFRADTAVQRAKAAASA